jgi:hypothetical protein
MEMRVMMRMKRGWALVGLWLTLCCAAVAQMATTTVSDTVYGADGRPAQGTVLISWPGFTAEDGSAVAGGSTAVTLGAKGSLSVALAPNAGSDPMGSYYTVQYHLNDGTVTRENWVVPVTSAPVTLAAIRSTVIPVSVAMQTVSKTYVDRAIANAIATNQTAAGVAIDTAAFVQAAPTGPQTVMQPVVSGAQTYQSVNALNGFKYASQFQTGTGNNGIANAFGTATGQTVMAEPTYGTADTGPASLPDQSHLIDYRLGSQADTFVNPTFHDGAAGWTTGKFDTTRFTTMPSGGLHAAGSSSDIFFTAPGYNYGSNGSSATNWSVHAGSSLFVYDFMRGISSGRVVNMTKHSTGDIQGFNANITAFGGTVAGSDEGVTPLEIEAFQITNFPIGTCTAGCTTGSIQITASMSQGGPFDNGGYLLDATQGGTHTATISAVNTTAVVSGASAVLYYDLTGITLTPSTAWGVIIPASCTNNGHGINQTYTVTTCNVTLGTAPASPGAFTTASHIFLSGDWEEEAAVTAVGAVSGGVQSISFSTRYAWDDAGNAATVMQGSVFSGETASQGFIQTGTTSFPIAYPVLGAVSATRLIFGNCAYAQCNAASGSGNMSHNILKSGGITFYPLVEIIGTGLGQNNVANLATNSIPFTSADAVWGAPTSEYHYANTLAYGQKTPLDNDAPSVGLRMLDVGPVPPFTDISVENDSGAVEQNMIFENTFGHGGGYINYFNLRDRPTNSVLKVGINGGSTSTYNVFVDGTDTVGGNSSIAYNPATNRFSMWYLDAPVDFTVGSNGFFRNITHIYSDSGGAHIDAVAGQGQSDITMYLKPLGAGTVDVSGAKITSVANGTVSTDAVAYGQLAASAFTDTTNAGNISAGTLADARLSSNVPLLNVANTFTPVQTFSGGIAIPTGYPITFSGSTARIFQQYGLLYMAADVDNFTDAYGGVRGSVDSAGWHFGSAGQAAIEPSGDITTIATIAPKQSTPGSSSDTCTAGQMWTDANYIYVCTATNTIKRAALSSF